jgi:uncharacterized protein YaaW (UPF0174 family)
LAKKLNLDQKRARQAAQLATFVQRYARKARRTGDPNDRRYDRSVENAFKQMPPDDLDRLLREDGR